MPYDIRTLTADDSTAAWELGATAFGYRDEPRPEQWSPTGPGRRSWGAFDPAGRLLAKAVDREQGQWFGGRVVPTSGVAGVAVAPELRGTGLGRALLTRLLAEARARGAVLSSLFPTTPFPYRSLGWTEVGMLTGMALPAAALGRIRPSGGVRLRPAVAEDVPALHAAYRAVARTGTGMMERSGPLFDAPPDEFLGEYHGVTVAEEPDGGVVGYAAWQRGPGYDAAGRLTVDDLVALAPAAVEALLSMLGSWASVAPTVVLQLPEPDPVFATASASDARVETRQPWMLRAVDAAGAVAARGWPRHLNGRVGLHLDDAECPWNAGPHQLVLSGGQGRLEPGGPAPVRLSARGFASWYAGAAHPALLRRAGLLAGGGEDTDSFLQAATAGPPPALLDYF